MAFKHKLNSLSIHAVSLIFIFGTAIISIVMSLSSAQIVHAGDCPGEKASTVNGQSCVKTNCQAIASQINANDCQKAIDACENTYIVGNGKNQTGAFLGFLETAGTGQGNCSNAIRSCFESETDTAACTDKDVLALATMCSEGSIGADGDCGMDQAIQKHNELDDGTDYAKNSGLKDAYKDKQVEAACKNESDTDKLQQCRNRVRQAVDACYDEQGGTGRKTSSDALADCMVKKAGSKGECLAAKSGSQWDEATQKCTTPPSPPPAKACGDADPDPKTGLCPDGKKPGEATGAAKGDVTGRCGTVATNILICGSGCADNSTPDVKTQRCADGSGSQPEDGTPVINKILQMVVFVLSVLVGVLAVGGLAWAAVLYAKAEDNQSNVAEARDLIRNVVIGLFLYIFMIAIVNFLVPGGVITTPKPPAEDSATGNK